MSKAEKRLKKWKNNTPKQVPRHEVEAMLDRYFPGEWEFKSGSHIVVTNEDLKGVEDYGPDGDFDIPIKGGQQVKGVYLKKLVYTIDLLKED